MSKNSMLTIMMPLMRAAKPLGSEWARVGPSVAAGYEAASRLYGTQSFGGNNIVLHKSAAAPVRLEDTAVARYSTISFPAPYVTELIDLAYLAVQEHLAGGAEIITAVQKKVENLLLFKATEKGWLEVYPVLDFFSQLKEKISLDETKQLLSKGGDQKWDEVYPILSQVKIPERVQCDLLLRALYLEDDAQKIGVIKQLCTSYDFDINARDKAGNTVLYSAADNGSPTLVKELISMGADPAIVTNLEDSAYRVAASRLADEEDEAWEILQSLWQAKPPKSQEDIQYVHDVIIEAHIPQQYGVDLMGQECWMECDAADS